MPVPASEPAPATAPGVTSATAPAAGRLPEPDVLRLVKTYRVRKGPTDLLHSLSVELRVENLTGREYAVSVVQYGPTGVPREPHACQGRPDGHPGRVPGQERHHQGACRARRGPRERRPGTRTHGR